MNRQNGNTKITALYSRLSRDDEAVGDSLSIQNQKAMLEKYAEQNGFSNIVHFIDDGFSGKDFDRPDWKRLIAEIEKGNVGIVIAKDMSRIGREYLQTGFYTEVYFKENGVRFIAISNNIDSINKESAEFAPFLNIVNEWYLRDTSRKIKASHKMRGMAGKRLTFNPIYGYVTDPADKTKWVIDPEAAAVVRRLYDLTIQGKGPVEIARILNGEKVERPSYYQHSRGIVNYSNVHTLETPYAWSGNSIARMIGKPEYAGHTVNFRTSMESYKDKRAKDNPREDWQIFENTHPPIVDQATWETAQRCRTITRRTDHGEANPLTGLVFCNDCGAKLYNHRIPYATTQINKKGYVCNRKPKDVYTCSTYSLTGRKFDRKCTTHTIRTVVLRELALEAIREVSGYVKDHEADFIKQVLETSAIRQEETAKAHRKRIAKEEKRIAELNTLFRKVYEDNASGKLNDKRFELLSQEYENEQTELEKSIITLRAELDGYNTDSAKAEKFIAIVKKYTDFSELTPQMLIEYVEKIVVHDAENTDGERTQTADIYLNFIGKFDLPAAEPTAEELQAEERAKRRRKNCREAQRRYAAKQKEKKEEQETAAKLPETKTA